MEKSKFMHLIDSGEKFYDFLEKLNDIGVDMWNTPIVKSFCEFERGLWKNEYGENGWEWIFWFLYEKMTSKHPEGLKAFDANGVEICANKNDLYDYLEKNFKTNEKE